MAKIWNLISLAGLLICIVLAFWAYQSGILDSVETLQKFIGKFGYGGMAIFVLIQIVQVVIPILPGGISCLGGVIFFGPWLGFVYNYIGICIGSLAAFGISRMMGRPILHKMFSEKLIQKYDSWTEKDSRFLKLFALAILEAVFACHFAWKTMFYRIVQSGTYDSVSYAVCSLGGDEIMKTYIYEGGLGIVAKSGVGSAIRHQKNMLK